VLDVGIPVRHPPVLDERILAEPQQANEEERTGCTTWIAQRLEALPTPPQYEGEDEGTRTQRMQIVQRGGVVEGAIDRLIG
jgi:hypothetical protein